MIQFYKYILHRGVFAIIFAAIFCCNLSAQTIAPDTTLLLNEITVSAIKQGTNLQNTASASTEIKGNDIQRLAITSVKNVSEIAPNLHIPDYGSRITSSIYVRGMGTRIDQPVIGLNIDNIPVMDKNNYDFDIADIARVEMIRGPQSTLFGRNTMGGLINIYTLSPLTYQGTRFMVEHATANSFKASVSHYHKFSQKFGASITAQYASTDGFFRNEYNGEKCDKEKQVGGRLKLQWRPLRNLHIDNTFYFSVLRQGGYPYESVESGKISYNDTCFYRRSSFNDGLTIRWIAPHFTLSSITSFQYIDDNMTLDQDFLPLSYFTLTQARKQSTITQDLVIKGTDSHPYKWLVGAFAFYKHLDMTAPVTFKDYGIDQLIESNRNEAIPSYPIYWDTRRFVLESDFENPSYGLALYHQSTYSLSRFTFTAGIRLDYEKTMLSYLSRCNTSYTTYQGTVDANNVYANTPIVINDSGNLSKDFIQILPKLSATYHLPTLRPSNVFISIAKGYKAGGFNTQMFSDVLQQKLMGMMGLSANYDINEVVGYKPEQSWNFEIGTHLVTNNGKLTADASVFYIHCTDQQLTRFPEGNTTGRIMSNAGKARSLGAELALKYQPIEQLVLNASYGYTNARFIEYNNGKEDFSNRCIPYSPTHTMFAGVTYTKPLRNHWLDAIVLNANVKGTGEIYWNEANSLHQPFYATANASIRVEHKNLSLDVWGQNLTNTQYKTFYFVSIGNAFLQRGKPRIIGATLRINL